MTNPHIEARWERESKRRALLDVACGVKVDEEDDYQENPLRLAVCRLGFRDDGEAPDELLEDVNALHAALLELSYQAAKAALTLLEASLSEKR